MSKGSNRPANGLPWKTGAISNAAWEGVLLADVLADAGFDAASDTQVKHVQFAAMEAYGASIPIRKAIDPQGDVLLAWGMNGQPLPRDHGFPLRSIVPGHVAARSVKWLNRVTLSDEESPSQWQRRDYKCFGPNETKVDWDAAPSIQEMPVQSAITSIRLDKATLEQDKQEDTGRPVSLSGYAYSGGGRAIVRVDVSLDGGATWSQAQLLPDDTSSPSKDDSHGSWSWKRWRYDGMIPRSVLQSEHGAGNKLCTSFVCKATDESYNTQPQSHAATWNVRGNLATAWHRVRVCADCKSGMLKQEA
jgi:sulfite oxidase